MRTIRRTRNASRCGAPTTFDSAIEQAENEALDYIEDTDWAYLGLAQCFYLGDDVTQIHQGTEVYSLIRSSPLPPDQYLDTFFDTGTEHQRSTDDPPGPSTR